ncbi:F-box/kelch-repeat protein At3g06240-like [Pyrus communis]|uniref:F-box/kelch-repeat protein At3g06240-like n=1 Tax=Pyrus communis TaxID=23211 RepID=UPI0035C05151
MQNLFLTPKKMSNGPNLSEDIIEDILSRLPVKSVCRFRCVSKLWLHLTTQPHFIQAHLKRTQSRKLLISSTNSLFSLDHLAPIDDDLLPLELDFPLKGGEPLLPWIQTFGSCNGLVCIMPVPEKFFIFNPTTRDCLMVPDCPMPIHVCPGQDSRNGYHRHSFGYAPSINDYKFVKVAYGCMVHVFSLKNNSWKRVQDFPYKHLLDDSTTFLNGAVHWLCGPVGVGATYVIAAFDLAEEKFLDLAPPDSVTNHTRFTIGVLGGCLCLLHKSSMKQHSFWVMKEYNVKESWTRILITDSYFSLQPLCYWKDGKILLVRNRKQLLLCNTKNGTCKKFLVNGLPFPIFADVYVESLVSPNFQQN